MKGVIIVERRNAKSNNVKSIVEKYLKSNGYDGLCNPGIECGCSLGNDFMPCRDAHHNCMPGYNNPCASCSNEECSNSASTVDLTCQIKCTENS